MNERTIPTGFSKVGKARVFIVILVASWVLGQRSPSVKVEVSLPEAHTLTCDLSTEGTK